MDKKVDLINLTLSEMEVGILTQHLFEYLQGNAARSETLIIKKFDLIEEVLFAKFGFKSTVFGSFQRKEPYFSDKHLRLVIEIKELNIILNKFSFSNHYLDKVYHNTSSLTNFNLPSPYKSISDINEAKWKNTTTKFNKLGISKSQSDFEQIITDLIDKS